MRADEGGPRSRSPERVPPTQFEDYEPAGDGRELGVLTSAEVAFMCRVHYHILALDLVILSCTELHYGTLSYA